MTEPLSIAMLSHMASPGAPTGAERSLAQLAVGLRGRGHRVAVAVPGPWCLAEGLREQGIEVVEIGCRVCWLTYYEPEPWYRAVGKWLRYALPDPGGRRLLSWLAGWEPHAVHVNCLPHVRGAAWASSRVLGVPVIWHLREILPPGVRREWFANRLREHARRIVAVSEAVGRWVRDEGLGDRLEVIPNGVDASPETADRASARESFDLPSAGFVIGQFGQLVPHKGAAQFIRAAHAAAESRPELLFLLAGPGPDEHVQSLRREIAAGPAAERIRLVPPQPAPAPLFAAADAVCLPTLTPDPFPRSVLEAMAAGLPVAAFRGGGVEEMVTDGETGLLVGSGDVAGLAAAFERLAADPVASRAMGEQGRRRAESDFSTRIHLDRMERLFRQAAEDR